MFRKITLLLVSGAFIFTLSGCATFHKQSSAEAQGLKNQISVLEAQIQMKDEEIENLRGALARVQEGAPVAAGKNFAKKCAVSSKVKSRPNMKQIQTALKNAGYNPGAIDGKTGEQTREAIKSFQKDNNLTADGKVGKQTWELLRKYLDKKVK